MQKYLVALTIVGIVDAISYMLVTPSLVFYVLQNGGSQQQYGIIMSAFSFSSSASCLAACFAALSSSFLAFVVPACEMDNGIIFS